MILVARDELVVVGPLVELALYHLDEYADDDEVDGENVSGEDGRWWF